MKINDNCNFFLFFFHYLNKVDLQHCVSLISSLCNVFFFRLKLLLYFSGEAVNWVQCDKCELWFHLLCVGLKKEEVRDEEDYVCFSCREGNSVALVGSPSKTGSADTPIDPDKIKKEPKDKVFDTSPPCSPSVQAAAEKAISDVVEAVAASSKERKLEAEKRADSVGAQPEKEVPAAAPKSEIVGRVESDEEEEDVVVIASEPQEEIEMEIGNDEEEEEDKEEKDEDEENIEDEDEEEGDEDGEDEEDDDEEDEEEEELAIDEEDRNEAANSCDTAGEDSGEEAVDDFEQEVHPATIEDPQPVEENHKPLDNAVQSACPSIPEAEVAIPS